MEWNDDKFSGTKLSPTIWTSLYFCGWIVLLCYLQTIFATEIQNRFCSLLKLVHKNNKRWTYAVLTLLNRTNFQSFFHPKWPIIGTSPRMVQMSAIIFILSLQEIVMMRSQILFRPEVMYYRRSKLLYYNCQKYQLQGKQGRIKICIKLQK